jgi:hypothetical protein
VNSPVKTQRQACRIHRWFVPIAAAPLLLGVLTIVVTGSGVVMLLRPPR